MPSDPIFDDIGDFVRAQSRPLQGTESAAKAIVRVKYSHDAMIEQILARPGISQNELAEMFGYTVPWVSRVMNSDAFLARLAERKHDLVDPALALTIDEKLRAIADTSLDIVQEKLSTIRSIDTAFKALDLSVKALGYGARQQHAQVQNNFVVMMPEKAVSAASWSEKHRPQARFVDVEPTKPAA
ncbi:cyclic nucleotide-binding domain [Bacteriophage sp.]|nr:cyclic nucleotide-binding domain [Bacteriophage sp.]